MSNDEKTREQLLKNAQEARSTLLEALTNLPKTVGCELVLRRKSKTGEWRKISMDSDFSLTYRKIIQEAVELGSEMDLCLLEYDAMSDGENMGVAYAKEIQNFVDAVPPKGSVKLFTADKGAFSNFNHRCARITLPGTGELLAFGPSGMKAIAAYKKSSVLAIFENKKIAKAADTGFLDVGSKVTFFLFNGFVFVIENSSFATITDFREVIRKRAQAALTKLEKLPFIKIVDFQGLKKLCDSSPDFAKRMSASDARGFFDRLTRQGLRDTMASFSITFEHEDDGQMITLNPNFSDVNEKRQFQELMTQVLVNCAVTGDQMKALKMIPYKAT